MVRLKKVGVFSLAKLQAVLMAFFGLVVWLIYTIFYTIISAIYGTSIYGTSIGLSGLGFGFLGIIILPVLYAILGFIGGAIGAFFYNLVAGWIGGIEMEFEQ